MKKSASYLVSFILVHLLATLCFGQASAGSKLSWIQTSLKDFSENQLSNLLITNKTGGEVQLSHPLVKITNDYNVNPYPNYPSRNSQGDYLKTWLQDRNIFVQKFSKDNLPLTDPVRVNDTAGIGGNDTRIRSAFMDNNTYIVLFVPSGYTPERKYDDNMYGQIFIQDSIRSGRNFRINEGPNYSTRTPSAFFNPSDSTFWIMFDAGNLAGEYKIYVQKRSLSGKISGQTFQLNKIPGKKCESGPMGAVCGDKLAVTWWGANTGLSSEVDIYARWYTLQGEPLTQTVRVNTDTSRQGARFSPWIGTDNKGSVIIAWGEIAWPSNEGQVKAQLFDPDGNKIRENIPVNGIKLNSYYSPCIEYTDGIFQISYRISVNDAYITRWKIDNHLSGEMTSSIFDTGPGGSEFEKIQWDGDFPQNTSVRFKIRSAKDTLQLKNSAWYGPLSDTAYYSLSGGQMINPINSGHRFIQYKAFFNTQFIHNSPILNSISINYIPKDSEAPAVPKDFSAKAGHSSVTLSWAANSENDLNSYILYKGTESKKYNTDWSVRLSPSITSYTDTMVVTGQTYYYSIAAMDSAGNISGTAPEASTVPLGINYYVSNKGSDRNDGSINNPFLTISTAVNAAKYGDKIVVLPGDYKDNVRMRDGISIIGSGAQNTKLLQKDLTLSIIYGSKDASIEGFTIEAHGPNPCPAISIRRSNLKVCDNRIILIGETYPVYPPAISIMDTAAPQILRNYMDGFGVGVNTVTLDKVIIKNNIIRARDVGIILSNILKDYCSEIINNTIIFGSYSGIQYSLRGDAIIRNNIIYSNDPTYSTGISGNGSAGGQYDISYNNIWNCKNNYLSITPGTGGSAKDPLFMNINMENYHLKSGSPCINAGDPSAQFNNKDGSRNDMGAYGGPDPVKDDVSQILIKALSVSKISAFPGDTVSVAVKIDNPAGILKGSFSLNFDPAVLTFLSTIKTPVSEALNVETTQSKGSINISFKGDSTLNSTDGEFLKFRFSVSQKSAGLTSPISLINVSVLDGDLNPIYIKGISDGMVSVGNASSSKNVIYVGTPGGIKEDGSYAYPFSTIQKGIDFAKYGDTVYAAGGEYNESLTMKEGVYVIGSGAVLTTLISQPDNTAVNFTNISKGELSGFTIKNKGLDPFMGLMRISNSSPGIFRNVIDCREGGSGVVQISGGSNPRVENNSFLYGGINITGKASPVIRNNHISLVGITDMGISCSDSCSPVFSGNKIRIEASYMYISGSSPVFKNNRITITGSPECFMISQAENVIISNNIIEDLGGHAKVFNISDAAGISIINNTLKINGSGIQGISSTGNIMNNIITGGKDFGISASGSLVLQNNDIWGNGLNYLNTSPGASDIQANPRFADDDFHLAQNSPCIDAGNPDAAFNDKNGSRNDMGAYGGPEADLDWVNLKNTCRLEIDSVHAALNDTVHLNVNAYSVKNTTDIEFTISYDPEFLSFLGAVPSALTQGFSMRKSPLSLSSAQITLTGSRPIGEDNGTIAGIIFQVKRANDAGSLVRFESASLKDIIMNPVLVSDMINGRIITNQTGVTDGKEEPSSCFLANNYPNPFNPETIIEYGIQKSSHVRLKIYNVLGQEIMTLIDKEQKAGRYRIQFNGITLSSGVYIYTLEAGNFKASRKLLLIK